MSQGTEGQDPFEVMYDENGVPELVYVTPPIEIVGKSGQSGTSGISGDPLTNRQRKKHITKNGLKHDPMNLYQLRVL